MKTRGHGSSAHFTLRCRWGGTQGGCWFLSILLQFSMVWTSQHRLWFWNGLGMVQWVWSCFVVVLLLYERPILYVLYVLSPSACIRLLVASCFFTVAHLWVPKHGPLMVSEDAAKRLDARSSLILRWQHRQHLPRYQRSHIVYANIIRKMRTHRSICTPNPY